MVAASVKLRVALLLASTIGLCMVCAPSRAAEPKPRTSIFDFGDEEGKSEPPKQAETPAKAPDSANSNENPPAAQPSKPPEIVVLKTNPTPAKRIRPATPPVVKAAVLKPIPDARVQAKILAQVKEQFKEEYRATGAERAGVALKLMEAGADTHMDADTSYVLLREARDMASMAGDARTGLAAARQINSRYSTDLTEMGLEVLMASARAASTPDKAADVAEVAMTLLNRAIATRQFELANRIAGIAEGSARFMHSTPLLSNIQAMEKDLSSRKAIAEKLAAAQQTLKTKPNDPAACAIVGRQYALEEGNWGEGLPYLAKSNDPIFKNLAVKDLAAPSEPLRQAELANLWWLAAQSQPVTTRLHMQERAAYLYTSALPGLLKKDQATARIAAAHKVMPEVVLLQLPVSTAAAANHRQHDPTKTVNPRDYEKINQSTTIEAGKPRIINGMLVFPEDGDAVKLEVGPGAEIRGGKIYLGRTGHLILRGTPEKPAILRGVDIGIDLGGSLEAEYAVIDDCNFTKSGAWFAYYSSTWIFKNTVLYKCRFASLNGVDVGFKFDACRMIGMTFPEIVHTRDAGKEFNHMDRLRKGMNHIEGCEFADCVVPPTVAWCGKDCNFIGCKFIPGEPFEGKEDFKWSAFVAETVGDSPQTVFNARPGTRGKVIVVPSEQPAEVPRFGEKALPEIVYTTRAVKVND